MTKPKTPIPEEPDNLWATRPGGRYLATRVYTVPNREYLIDWWFDGRYLTGIWSDRGGDIYQWPIQPLLKSRYTPGHNHHYWALSIAKEFGLKDQEQPQSPGW